MDQAPFLQTLGWMVITSGVLLLLARRLSVPSIVIFIAAGLTLGPLTGIIDLSAAFDASRAEQDATGRAIALMSEIGIGLLLFLVGLELSLDRIRDVGKVAVVAGLGQVVFTASIGFALTTLLGYSAIEGAFLATALTFSSTVVVVKLLNQRNELHALYGRIAVGIFLVQDLVVIVALTVLAGLGSAAEQASAGKIAADLGLAFGGMGLMLLAALWASRALLPKPFAWATQRPEMLLVWSLALCFSFVLAAEMLHLSPEIGAFLAGVSLAQLGCAHDLRRRVQPLMNFFIAIFFVTLGAQMRLEQASEQWLPALTLSLFVLLGNPLIFMVIISRYGYSERTSFKTSVTVAQISEFSFVFIAMGMSAGLVGEAVLAVVAVVGLVTIVSSSYMILYSDGLYDLVRRSGALRVFRAAQGNDDDEAPDRSGHVIVVGMNTLGRRIVADLAERGVEVVAIDTDPAKLRGLRAELVVGNVEHLPLLEEAGYRHARLVVSALRIEDTNDLLAYVCGQAGVPCAIHGFDPAVQASLRELGVEYVIDSKRAGMAVLARRVEGAA